MPKSLTLLPMLALPGPTSLFVVFVSLATPSFRTAAAGLRIRPPIRAARTWRTVHGTYRNIRGHALFRACVMFSCCFSVRFGFCSGCSSFFCSLSLRGNRVVLPRFLYGMVYCARYSACLLFRGPADSLFSFALVRERSVTSAATVCGVKSLMVLLPGPPLQWSFLVTFLFSCPRHCANSRDSNSSSPSSSRSSSSNSQGSNSPSILPGPCRAPPET